MQILSEIYKQLNLDNMKFSIDRTKTGNINKNFLGGIIGPILGGILPGIFGGGGGGGRNSLPPPPPPPPPAPVVKDNTPLYLGIGGAVVVVLGLMFTMKR
jgi:hypothetical protein